MTTGPPEAGWLLGAGSHEVIAPYQELTK